MIFSTSFGLAVSSPWLLLFNSLHNAIKKFWYHYECEMAVTNGEGILKVLENDTATFLGVKNKNSNKQNH